MKLFLSFGNVYWLLFEKKKTQLQLLAFDGHLMSSSLTK